MSSTQLVVLGIVGIILVACALGAWTVLRSRSLKQQFGPEYDRVVEESDGRLAAEHELRERQRRHNALDLKELSPQSRTGYAQRWRDLQVQFVDSPSDAVNEADNLVTGLLEELGYPNGDYREQIAQLSVDHASTLESYREAHEISDRNRSGEATTEDLRLAIVNFRALVTQLLGQEPAVAPADSDWPPANHLQPSTGEVRA